MTPVDMTVMHDPENGAIGDCFRCCIASLLDMQPEQVPHFMDYPWDDPDGGKWFRHLNQWLRDKGLAYIEINVDPQQPWKWGDFVQCGFDPWYIWSGESPRARHSTVAQAGILVHDPHPSRAGLVGPYKDGSNEGCYSYGFIVKRCGP